MPKDPIAQAKVTEWMFAALSSVEPFVMMCATVQPDQRNPVFVTICEKRLDVLAPKLEGREYLMDRFSAADILMAHVLHTFRDDELLMKRPSLASYRERCFARPAYKKALADHLASFDESAGPKPKAHSH